MAGKKDVEVLNEGLILLTNVIVSELKKILREVITETLVACNSKANPVQCQDSSLSAPQVEGDRLLRLREVLEYVPISKSHWWSGVRSGRYPAPVKNLGPRIAAWKRSSIMQLVDGKGARNA